RVPHHRDPEVPAQHVEDVGEELLDEVLVRVSVQRVQSLDLFGGHPHTGLLFELTDQGDDRVAGDEAGNEEVQPDRDEGGADVDAEPLEQEASALGPFGGARLLLRLRLIDADGAVEGHGYSSDEVIDGQNATEVRASAAPGSNSGAITSARARSAPARHQRGGCCWRRRSTRPRRASRARRTC